ncbi:hypothetical protein BLNAU_9093 [Blattamonas nauphoetae]|uniref:Uncharacterized protein n=1 Tax=Blattamonas nauphoetae TaxID=2049346 RepID=A0ABQ9XWT4_9EUKA|nr:hypothetical protein BLNAU_9093 [Blattamonas nauphoetae]
MVALVEHFVDSGDLILQSPPFLPRNLAFTFKHFVLQPEIIGPFFLADHSFLHGDTVECTEQLIDAVRKVKETHSLEVVRNLHFDWKEWVTMMEMVEKGVTALTDLSFLQSRCFRPTLEALQAKHQHIVNPSPIEENGHIGSLPFRTTHDPSLISSTVASPLTSLHRCLNVIDATKSTQCIVDIHSFLPFLISGLHSSNSVVQFVCFTLFFKLRHFDRKVDDPRDHQFQSLRKAFRDGTYWQNMTLLHLWMRWLEDTHGSGSTHVIAESDFDFSGLLDADLSDRHLFNFTCSFVGRVLFNDTNSIPKNVWKLYFLVQFEKRHQMMSRLSTDQSASFVLGQPKHTVRHFAAYVSAFLSVIDDFAFPSALTEVIATDLDPNPHHFSTWVNPAYFLCHTSIPPNHRHSFFPMDLLFERFLRDDPDALLSDWPERDIFTPSKFLITPSIAPFGACSSLAVVFTMLASFTSNPEPFEMDLLSTVGQMVVSLHWLSIPAHFDSPLLCHLPSLAGAQRGVLQTLSSHSGIPSLITPLTILSYDFLYFQIQSINNPVNQAISLFSMYGRYVTAEGFSYFRKGRGLVIDILHRLHLKAPAIVSTAIEFCHRLVTLSSDAVRIDVAKLGLLDHIVSAVSNSSFLDDYEKGVAVIGILLDTIRRDHLKRQMRGFDFSRGLNRHSGGSSSL